MTQPAFDNQHDTLPTCRLPSRLTQAEPTQLTDFTYVASIVNAIILPLFAVAALILAKFSHGEAARQAERQFLATLVIMTIITVRTVITCDDVWLIHTATLATMIVGALVVPSQDPSVAV